MQRIMKALLLRLRRLSLNDIETKITNAVQAGDLSTLPDIFLMQDNSFQKYVTFYPDVFTSLGRFRN